MESDIGQNTKERMSDRPPRGTGDFERDVEAIPTDDVDDANIGDAMPSVDDV